MSLDLHQVLKAFGAKSLKGSKTEVVDLVTIEKEIGIKFPTNYGELLCNFSESIIFTKGVTFKPIEATPLSTSNGDNTLEILFGLNGLSGMLPMYRRYKEQLHDDLIAIGESAGGDLICLSKLDHSVVLWNHDTVKDEHATFIISSELDEFFLLLKEEDSEVSPMVDKIVKSKTSIRIKPKTINDP